MIELIKGLEIEGCKFASRTTLDFFTVPQAGAIPERLTFLYMDETEQARQRLQLRFGKRTRIQPTHDSLSRLS